MNILIPDSWLKEHLGTKATPRQIAKYLTLCSQSVERLTPLKDDWLYEIEITTNRPDCLSVIGIARELAAILPRFNIRAKLRPFKEEKKKIQGIKIATVRKNLKVNVEIKDPSLCPRFTALIFDNITIKPSPQIVQDRLKKCKIRAINNIIDISNYLMLELGQPMHTFDYDKVKGAKMILRESKEKESIITLDGQKRELPTGSIIIEDGEERIIDLCGIMGGQNSAVDENTHRVLLFVQTYNPALIRQTCQKLSFRTEAASRFEKGVDPQGVMLAIKKAITMFQNNCGASIASKIIDIYPHPLQPKKITLDTNQATKAIGVQIPQKQIISYLESLGFYLLKSNQSVLTFSIPHWRTDDISIPEDLIEEVARLYGYQNLPSNLPVSQYLFQNKNTPNWLSRIRQALKYWGFTETFNFSMINLQSLKKANVNPATCLQISNTLSEDWLYLRPTLIPSILEVIAKNQAETKEMKIFEIANVYLPRGKDQLPKEILKLTIALSESDFLHLKGVVEGLLDDLGIKNLKFVDHQSENDLYGKIFDHACRTDLFMEKTNLGIIGRIDHSILWNFAIKGEVFLLDLDIYQTLAFANSLKKYSPISRYPAIIEDFALLVPPRTTIGQLIQIIGTVSPLIKSVELIDSYQNTRTFRIAYQSFKRTLTGNEVEKTRHKIIEKLREIKANLKSLPAKIIF